MKKAVLDAEKKIFQNLTNAENGDPLKIRKLRSRNCGNMQKIHCEKIRE